MQKNPQNKAKEVPIDELTILQDKEINFIKILVLGPKGSGKTSLLTTIRSLKDNTYNRLEEQLYKIQPTVGVEIEEYIFKNKTLSFKEVGSAMTPRLYKFLEEKFNYILYIYCPLNIEQVSIAINEFINLQILNENKKKVILIMNKFGCMALENYNISENAFLLKKVRSEYEFELMKGEVIEKIFVESIMKKIAGEEELSNNKEAVKVSKPRCCACIFT